MSGGGLPVLVPIAEIVVRLGEPVDFGVTRDGRRRCTPVLGGELTWFGIGAPAPVAGGGIGGVGGAAQAAAPNVLRNVRAQILHGGGDRQLVRVDPATGDEVVEIDARYDAVSDAGAPIGIRASGVRRHPPGGASAYFRVAVRFETADPALGELQNALFVADGARLAREVRHTVYLVG